MLPTGEVVKEVYLDQSNGVVAGAMAAATEKPVRKLLIECGTIESATILEVGKAVDEAQSQLSTGSVLGEYFCHGRCQRIPLKSSTPFNLTSRRLRRCTSLRRA